MGPALGRGPRVPYLDLSLAHYTVSRRHLTEKQLAFLDFLRQHVQTHRVWPTYREVVGHFDFRSPNSVTQNLQALARKGYLERDRNGYRLADGTGDGRVSVRAELAGGAVQTVAPTEYLSLASLFQDVEGLHALRLDPSVPRTDALDGAEYVFVGAAPEDGAVVVLADGEVAIADRAGGRVTLLGGAPLDGAEVLGAYAGHGGPFGVVRHQRERVAAR